LLYFIYIKSVHNCVIIVATLHGKNDFAEESKILLDTNLKIILLEHQNNFVNFKHEQCKKFW